MTTYAPPPVLTPDQTTAYWQTTPPGGGMPRPTRTNRRRRGVVAAWVAVAAAAASLAVSAVNVSTPQAAPVHTVVMPAGPVTYTADQVAAAKQQTCAAWKTASAQMGAASNVAAADPHASWNNPNTQNALAAEARTTVVEAAYLRSQMGAATPAEVSGPIHDYLVASFDMEHWTMRRNGPNVDAAIDRGNAAADKADAACA